jgi:hypothetical protein
MKIELLILTFLILIIPFAYGQKKKVPKNIQEAITILQNDCPDSLKRIIKTTSNDSLLNLSSPWGGNYETISNWTFDINSSKKTKLEKYYSKLGITYPEHIVMIVLISFKAHLNNDNITEDKIIKPFQEKEIKWAKEDSLRFTSDSLRGIYIPKDLGDCFKQIDSFWNDSTKMKAKSWSEKDFIAKTHFGLGLWMRNNWQLWGGSRLSKYFNDMGIYDAENMSGVILKTYHRYLTDKNFRLEKQIQFYQDHYKKVNNQNKTK